VRVSSTPLPRSEKRAVILLSGGLDSATTLALAREQGFDCYALSVAYGQRHSSELDAAARVARALGVLEHRTMHIDLAGIGGSALTDSTIAVPEVPTQGIPVTYVPARNTLLLALALGWAEVLGSTDIFIGVNAIDFSGYPDCRLDFIGAFEKMAALATRAGVEGHPCRVHTPLISFTKAEIIRAGQRLGVNLGATVSCYQADELGRACGRCDSCRIRKDGFDAAGVPDPTPYQGV
jgi:7-cyano-7-deazaguanine synthase